MILALDYGEKRVGVAVTDESEKFVVSLDFISNNSELKRVKNSDFPKGTPNKEIVEVRKTAKKDSKLELRKLFNKICHLVNYYYPDKILIGIPMTVDKETNELVKGKQAIKIESFSKKLQAFLKSKNVVCDIELIEESMSTVMARANLKEKGLTETKIKQQVDSESARILLEEYVNH